MSDGQDLSEGIRKEVTKNFNTFAKSNSAYKLARHVDGQVLDKCMVSIYGQYENNLNRQIGEDPQVEKNRGRYGSGYHPAEVNLTTPFEKIFFDNMGRGYNSSAPSRIGEEYVCPCGLKFGMSQKLAPLECPICHRLTPRGMLTKDNPSWYKR